MRTPALLRPCALAALFAACAAPLTQTALEAAVGEAPEDSTRLVDRVRRNAATGEVVQRWTEFVHADGTRTAHGPQTLHYPDGTLRAERVWENGEPAGTWRAWHPDGSLRALTIFDPENAATPMGFWHPGGAKAAAGVSRRGLREGLWTFWYPDGTPREQGRFVANRREGVWSMWNEDGSLDARGAFEAGVRVGEWERGGQ